MVLFWIEYWLSSKAKPAFNMKNQSITLIHTVLLVYIANSNDLYLTLLIILNC